MNKNILKDIFFNNISQGLQFGSRWVLSLVLIAFLNIEDFAVFSYVYSLSNILVSLLPFGSSIFLISKNLDKDENAEILQDSFAVVILLFLLVFTLYLILTPIFGNITGWGLMGYGIILSLILSLNLVLFSFFKGLGMFKAEMYSYSFFSFSLLIFILYLYSNSGVNDISFIFKYLIGINLLVFIGTIVFTYKRIKLFNKKIYKGALKNTLLKFKKRRYFGFQEIVSAIYTQIGLILLFYIIDETTYGYYRALFVVMAPIFMITVATSQVVLNQLKQKKENINNLKGFFRKTQKYTFGLGALIVSFFYLFRDLIFSFINIRIDHESMISFNIITIILLMRFIFSNYEMLLVALDRQKQRFWVMFLSALISITLMFIILPEQGLVGAFFINFMAYFIVMTGTLIISERTLTNLSKS